MRTGFDSSHFLFCSSAAQEKSLDVTNGSLLVNSEHRNEQMRQRRAEESYPFAPIATVGTKPFQTRRAHFGALERQLIPHLAGHRFSPHYH
jgi:hypothetical protein